MEMKRGRVSKARRIGDTHKSCLACDEMLPMSEYYIKANGKNEDGTRRYAPTSQCKKCYIKKQLEWYYRKKSENA